MEEYTYELLDRVHTPQDLKDIREEDLPQFVEECRDWLIRAVSKTGGHLAASLGAAEITVATHYVFEAPRDKICWDVGHQAYIHKMLTGRREHFPTIRQWRGMSGFLRRVESEYDAFGAGHGGTSISAALGMNEAKHQQGQRHKSVAIIGDGSFTCGMAFEAMNHAGHLGRDLIVILNDNEWGISPNVGAVGQFLNRNTSSKSFIKIKREIKKWVVNNAGPEMAQRIGRIEDAVKTAFLPGSALFEAFGFDYMGPVDGHDVNEMVRVLRAAKASNKPVLIHTYTQKGHGWEVAEADPLTYHGLGKYNPVTGEIEKKSGGGAPAYTKVFANAAIELANEDDSIVAITAAMPTGTGLNIFEKEHPDRTYDVGMCEQHGVTFAAGMASEGMHPICAIYSTFLQRGYDQVVHDVCLQKLPVVFAMDRAGLVGADGATHMGLYDISYMRSLPNMVVMAPKDENELRHMLKTAVYCGSPAAIRYPRGTGTGVELEPMRELPLGKGELLEEGGDIAIIAYGTPVNFALEAARQLKDRGIHASVVNARYVKPMDRDLIRGVISNVGRVITVEDGALMGGFGSAVLEMLQETGDLANVKDFRRLGVPDEIVEHGGQPDQWAYVGIDANGIYNTALEMLEVEQAGVRSAAQSSSRE